MVVDLPVAQEVENPIDLIVGDFLAKSDAVNVGDRHQHRRVVRDDAQVEKTAGSTKNSFLFDPFDDTETMVRVDDLVAELECHVSPVAGSGGRTGLVAGNSTHEYSPLAPCQQREMAEKPMFSALQTAVRPVRREGAAR